MYIAGVDIGGTSIKFGVVDDNYEFVYSEMFPPVQGDPQATVQRIVKAYEDYENAKNGGNNGKGKK